MSGVLYLSFCLFNKLIKAYFKLRAENSRHAVLFLFFYIRCLLSTSHTYANILLSLSCGL